MVLAAAWSLGGGSAGPGTAPAAEVTNTDAAEVTEAPNDGTLPYRVAFDVRDGTPRPDGPVLGWADIDNTTFTPVEFTVRSSEGTVQAAGYGPVHLGDALAFNTVAGEAQMTVTGACETLRSVDVRLEGTGTLQLAQPITTEGLELCSRKTAIEPLDVLGSLPAAGTATHPALAWQEDQLIITGQIDPDVLLQYQHGVAEVEDGGPRIVVLTDVPATELDPDATLIEGSEFAAGTNDTGPGTWHLLDQRGLGPEPGGPQVAYDGSTWTVTVCGESRQAPGTIDEGSVQITGPWSAAGDEEVPCPQVPWQEPAALEGLLQANPEVRISEGEFGPQIMQLLLDPTQAPQSSLHLTDPEKP
ncbi:hypothetical protein [Serinicoccus sp. LYQ131]|uniref:hypothetical protein n=1 Tax=Serinicoccus sp. LYQ131 TaxID=3378797 RepID=UPI0038525EE3